MANAIDVYPPRDLPGRADNWGRRVEEVNKDLLARQVQIQQMVENGLRSTSGQLAVLSRQIDTLASQQEFLISLSRVVSGSFSDIRQVAQGQWMPDPVEVTLSSPSGRIEITFGGSANNGGTVFAYQVVGATSGTVISRGSILTDLSKRVAVTGGATFYPSGFSTVIEQVPVNEALTISLHAYADNAFPDVYISGGRILVRVAP